MATKADIKRVVEAYKKKVLDIAVPAIQDAANKVIITDDNGIRRAYIEKHREEFFDKYKPVQYVRTGTLDNDASGSKYKTNYTAWKQSAVRGGNRQLTISIYYPTDKYKYAHTESEHPAQWRGALGNSEIINYLMHGDGGGSKITVGSVQRSPIWDGVRLPGTSKIKDMILRRIFLDNFI